MLNDVRESEGNRREWIVEVLKDIDGMHTGYLHKGELVRCKECRWADKCSQNVAMWDDRWADYEKIEFCSYGEREGE